MNGQTLRSRYMTDIPMKKSKHSGRSYMKSTPPALAALPPTNNTPFSCKYFVASNVVGMLAPSVTDVTPFATNILASSMSNSFWVAHGRAKSTLYCHTPCSPFCFAWYSADGFAAAYSVKRARFTSFTSFNNATVGGQTDYVAGANIAGFEKVVDAMIAQGVC